MSAPLRILYFGTPAFAVPTLRALIASRHPVAGVVSQPDRPRGRGHQLAPTATKTVALEAGLPVLQPEKIRTPEFLDAVRALAPDLGVVAAYGRILPETLLAIPRLGMINVHGSILPRWRGAAPVHRAVIAGDAETGITIMRVVKELDAGAMLAIGRRPIALDDTSADVERALAEMGASLLVDTVDAIAEGRAVETAQPADGVTYAAKLEKSEGTIDWRQPAATLHDLVRGLQPWPLVAARLGGHRVIVHRTALTDRTSSEAPCTVVDADGLAVVGSDSRVLRLLELQPEGRRVMTSREYLAGRRIEPGSTIETA